MKKQRKTTGLTVFSHCDDLTSCGSWAVGPKMGVVALVPLYVCIFPDVIPPHHPLALPPPSLRS